MSISIILQLFAAALVSLVSVSWVFPKILKVAKQKNLVDNPDARKLQKTPIPVLGGIAVAFGLICGLLVFTVLFDKSSLAELYCLLPVSLGIVVMLYAGSLDDMLDLSPLVRLAIEILVLAGIIFSTGMCIDSLHGLFGIETFSWWIAVPLTIFAGVGIINAYNMVDGVNGLSSGLCIVGSAIMAIVSFKRSEIADAALSVCFAAALVPFFLHNVFGKTSKMYIGDGGTMVMGLLVTWLTIRVLSSNSHQALGALSADGHRFGLVAMVLGIASVPVFDTLRVMGGRIVRGVSPLKPDRTHLHHMFIDAGISHSITALCEIAINLVIFAIWYLSYKLGASVNMQFAFVALSSVLLVWGFYFLLDHTLRHRPDSWLLRWAGTTHFGSRKWWIRIQEMLDRGTSDD